MLLDIEGADAAARSGLSRSLAAAPARASGDFAAVANGEHAPASTASASSCSRTATLLSPAVTERRFTVEGLREAISETWRCSPRRRA